MSHWFIRDREAHNSFLLLRDWEFAYLLSAVFGIPTTRCRCCSYNRSREKQILSYKTAVIFCFDRRRKNSLVLVTYVMISWININGWLRNSKPVFAYTPISGEPNLLFTHLIWCLFFLLPRVASCSIERWNTREAQNRCEWIINVKVARLSDFLMMRRIKWF